MKLYRLYPKALPSETLLPRTIGRVKRKSYR